LIEVEYLKIFSKIIEEVIGLVLEDLYSGNVDVVVDSSDSIGNNKVIDEVNSCIVFRMNSIWIV